MADQLKQTFQENISMLPNGLVQDIDRVTRREYANKMNPIMFDNHGEYSLKGIIEQTPMSQIFFSPMNVNGIQSTIRYRIFKTNNVTISAQSENELFIVMRSIYLQYSKNIQSNDVLAEIKYLNKLVINYSVEKITTELVAYNRYLQDINNLPIPMGNPEANNEWRQYTYDMTNII